MTGKCDGLLVVDDHQLVCEAVAALIEMRGLAKKVYTAFSGEQALDALKTNHIQVALVDARMNGMSGIDLAKTILRKYPQVRVVGMTIYNEDDTILEMLHTGLHGILLKGSADGPEISFCLQEVLGGNSYYSAAIQARLNRNEFDIFKQPKTQFTKRETEILVLLCAGKSSKQIAEVLNLKPATVEGYRKEMLHKTETKSTAELVAFVHRNGVV
jgi:DNA-binding NarL/FixJ family response regulator